MTGSRDTVAPAPIQPPSTSRRLIYLALALSLALLVGMCVVLATFAAKNETGIRAWGNVLPLLQAMQTRLAAEYDEPNVGVRLDTRSMNGSEIRSLLVTFPATRVEPMEEWEVERQAEAIARSALAIAPPELEADRLCVVFVAVRTVGPLRTSRTDAHCFPWDAEPATEPGPGDAGEPASLMSEWDGGT